MHGAPIGPYCQGYKYMYKYNFYRYISYMYVLV